MLRKVLISWNVFRKSKFKINCLTLKRSAEKSNREKCDEQIFEGRARTQDKNQLVFAVRGDNKSRNK